MITLKLFLENITPFNFFDSEKRATDYYFAIENSLFQLAGCMLQEGFNNINLQAINFANNNTLISTLSRLNFGLSNSSLLYLSEQDFLINLNDFFAFKDAGIYHVFDLISKDGNTYSVNRLNYFLTELTAYSVQNGVAFYSDLNNFLTKNATTTDSLTLEFKKFIVADFLSKNDNGVNSFQYNAIKAKSLAIIKYYHLLFENVQNNSIITGILFENIVNKESYQYFINKMLTFNCSNLINVLNIADA
jgi:hypothetical protein